MSDFNYKDKETVKLTEEFKQKFSVNIKGKEAIKLEGLTALGHEKGMWKFETEIIQFPSDQNGWTAICKTTIGGYDWDPVTEKVREVIYSDIGDANAGNCGKMVAASYIRMASTRSQGRALRKYTNVDMVCSSELDSAMDTPPEPFVSTETLTAIKQVITSRKMSQDTFGRICTDMFGHTRYVEYTETQGKKLLEAIKAYVLPNSSPAAQT